MDIIGMTIFGAINTISPKLFVSPVKVEILVLNATELEDRLKRLKNQVM